MATMIRLLLTTLMLCATVTYAQDEQLPSGATIQSVQYAGTGCPQGSISSLLSVDAQALTVIFDQYAVETAGEAPQKKNTKDCQIRLEVAAPKGWSYSIASMQIRGFADLDAGATGIQTANLRYGRSPGGMINLGRLKLDGEYRADYEQAFDLTLRNLNWSSCAETTKPVIINTQIAVKSRRGAKGSMTVDSFDGQMSHEYNLLWKQCDGRGPQQFAAQCKAQFTKNNANKVREVMAAARGSSIADAEQKAQDKALRRCNQRARRGGTSCTLVSSSCVTAAL